MPNMTIAKEEIFGPVLSVLKCNSLEQAIEITNDVAYGLSSSIYTKDINGALLAARDIETGICYINAPTIGAEAHMPFGGVKATGDAARDFAQNEIASTAVERDLIGEFPHDVIKKLGELGFMGMMVSPDWGGSGLDCVSYVLAMEEISKIDASVAVVMSVNNSL